LRVYNKKKSGTQVCGDERKPEVREFVGTDVNRKYGNLWRRT